MPTTYFQRWHFKAFFGSEQSLDFPIATTEDEVRTEIERRYPGGNWKKNSLHRGKKVKEKNARRRS